MSNINRFIILYFPGKHQNLKIQSKVNQHVNKTAATWKTDKYGFT